MAERLLKAPHPSPQRRFSDPALPSGSSTLSDFLNTRPAHTLVGTSPGFQPKWVSGPNSQDATTAALDRGGPGETLDPNSTTTYTNSPNAPYEQAERQTRHEVVQKGFTSFMTTMSKNAGEGLKKDLEATNATDMFNDIRAALRGLILVANDSKTAIPLHKFMDPKAKIESMLGGFRSR